MFAYFDPDKEMQIYVDASAKRLGVFIAHRHNGKEHVVEYASRITSDIEEKLHSNMLECITLHWALTDKFRAYAYGLPVAHVWRDNYSASLMTNTQQINRKFACLVLDIQELPLKIHHRSGKSNVVPNALLCIPERALVCLVLTAENSHLSLHQQSDPSLLEIIEVLGNPEFTSHKVERVRKTFSVSTGIFCYNTTDTPSLVKTKIVIPESPRQQVLNRYHDKSIS